MSSRNPSRGQVAGICDLDKAIQHKDLSAVSDTKSQHFAHRDNNEPIKTTVCMKKITGCDFATWGKKSNLSLYVPMSCPSRKRLRLGCDLEFMKGITP